MKFQINYRDTPFLLTSETAPYVNRLNWRAEILLTRNKEAIKDKKILDLASHDGRFSYACLKLGAAHVTGIEARPHLVRNAMESFSKLEFDPHSFTFIQNDVFDYLPKVKQGEFDTILCFGFFYHTIRQIELLREIGRIRPKYFILDTRIEKEVIIKDFKKRGSSSKLIKLVFKIKPKHFVKLKESIQKAKKALSISQEKTPCLIFRYENNEREGLTIDPIKLVAYPTKSFIEQFFSHCGYAFKQLNWSEKEINDWTGINVYRIGMRVSYIAKLF